MTTLVVLCLKAVALNFKCDSDAVAVRPLCIEQLFHDTLILLVPYWRSFGASKSRHIGMENRMRARERNFEISAPIMVTQESALTAPLAAYVPVGVHKQQPNTRIMVVPSP